MSISLFRSILTSSIAGLLTSFASAAPLTWDGNADTAPNPDGGTGTWDVTSSNWWDGSTNVLWPASGTDNDAIFANTAGTVSLAATGVTANDLTFNTTGYLIQSNTLTLNGTSPTITAGLGITATISSIIAGSSGMTKAGQGTLILTGANSYTTGTTISGGTLQIGDATVNGTIGAGTYSIASGTKLYLNYLTAAAPTWANLTGAGTLELNSAQAVNGSANWGTVSLGAGFTGTLQLDKGRMTATPAALGGTTKVVLGNGSQFLAYDGTANGTAYTYAQSFSINGMGWGEGSQDLGAIRVSGMNATFSGGITLTGNSGLYTQSGPSTMTVSGLISDGGSGFGLAINSLGAAAGIVLSNTGNSYGGGTTVSTGILKLGAANVIPDGVGKGNVTVTSTLNLNTFSETINGLTGAGTVDTVAGGTPTLTVGNSDATSSFGGVIKNTAGTLSLTKIGTGTLTLSGANTYTGTTIIANGTLAFSTVSPALTGGVTFGAAAGNAAAVGALDVSAVASTATFTGALLVRTNNATANTIDVGSKTLTINGGMTLGYDAGSGTGTTNSKLTVTGAGTLAVNGTTITLGVNQAASGAAYFSTGTLDVTGLGNFTTNVTNLNLGVGSNTPGAGNLLLSNTANTLKATTLVVGDTVGNNGNGSTTLTLGTGTNVINADTINIGFGKLGGTFKFASQTAGSPGTVTIANKAGSGAATITVGNFNGAVTSGSPSASLNLAGHVATVSAGTLTVGKNDMSGNTGTDTGTVSFDAGTFTVATLTMAPKSGTGTGNANATLNVGGGAFTVNTAFTLGSQATAGASFPTLNITGGTFISSANIVEGGGTVTSVINLNGATAILDMGGGGVVHNLGDATNVINTFTFTNGTLRNIGTVFGGITLAGSGSRVFDQTGALSGEVKGVISGPSIGLQKTGSGALTLSGNNTFSGGVTLQGAGALTLGHSNAAGTGTILLQATPSGGNTTLNLTGGITMGNAIQIDTTTGRENITSASGTNVLNSNVQLTGASAQTIILANNSGSTFQVKGNFTTAVANASQISLRGNSAGGSIGTVGQSGQINLPDSTVNGNFSSTTATWTFNSTGNTWAATQFGGSNAGSFILGATDALCTTAKFSWSGAATAGILDLNGKNQTVAGLDAANTPSATQKITNNSTTTDSTLTLAGLGANYTFAGVLADGATNKVSLVMNSAGQTQTLSGTNTYTGATTVTAGTLLINGSNFTSETTVNGGTLGGTGFVGGVTVNSGGTIAPGSSGIGTLHSDAVLMGPGSTLAVELGATTWDQLAAGTASVLVGDVNLTIALTAPAEITEFTILDGVDIAASYTAGARFVYSGNSLDEGEIFAVSGQDFSISYAANGGNDVVLTLVPEPSAVFSLLGGLGMMLGLRRRRTI